MRLLNTMSMRLELFPDSRDRPAYAILSHTWGEDECSFQDMISIDPEDEVQRKSGFAKIRFTCDQAKGDGYEYAWIDTCCIDKSSSTELSEAINSM